MRKRNLFSKKIFQFNVVYVIILVFLLMVAAYFAMTKIQSNRLEALEAERAELQSAINQALGDPDVVEYFTLAEIIPVLPNVFDEFAVTSEIEFVKSLSGLANATNYTISYRQNAPNPIPIALNTIKTVGIDIVMNVSDYQNILVFIENLIDQERFYFISNWNATLFLDGSATVTLTFYTFYNDVIV